MKIDLINNALTIQINVKSLNNRQALKLKDLIKTNTLDAIRYIESFKGKQARLNIADPSLSRGESNPLENKKSGTILKRFESLFRYDGSTPQPSTSDSDYIGVEIECLIPRNGENYDEYGECDCECNHDVREDGTIDENADPHSEDCASNRPLPAESEHDVRQRCMDVLREFRVKDVRVKDDGSLTDNDTVCGVEFVCLTRLSNLDNLNKLCLAIKSLKAKIDSSCGLHVHIDCRQGDGQAVARRLKKALPLLNLMVPKSRIDNRYCERDVSTRGHRYAKINRESLAKYKTIEVRMHSGTTDFEKIKNWIMIVHSIGKFDSRLTKEYSPLNLGYFASKLNWSLNLVEYVLNRVNKFNPSHNNATPATSEERQAQAVLAA